MTEYSSRDAPWWLGATIYQIYPRSFQDSNGDGVGDLPGILSRLDHVASLGVDGIWLSPFFTSPMADFGYDVSDFRGVDPLFGTLADFDAVLARAHALGLKLIIDQVYSHTSDQHPWFAESRRSRDNARADWYVWADPKPDGTPPNNWQSVFGMGAWQWDARRGQYYLHNFLVEQPDLNLHNPEVQDAILDVTRFWLERGVDGFRLDALNFGMHDPQLRDNPVETEFKRPPTRPFDFQRHTRSMSHPDIPAFLERIGAVVRSYPDRFTVAEVGGPHPLAEMKAFTQGEARLDSAYNFDFLYAESISAARVRESLSQWPGTPGPGGESEGWPSWAFSNHDAPRAVTRWRGEAQRARYAKLLLLTLASLRGNLFLYQGEELGLPQGRVPFEALQDPEAIANWPETLGRDGARTPMPWSAGNDHAGFSETEPWLPVDAAHPALSVAAQDGDPDSVLAFARETLRVRRASEALRRGDLEFLTEDALLALRRTVDGETVTAMVNLTDGPLEMPEQVGEVRLSVGEWDGRQLAAYSGVVWG